MLCLLAITHYSGQHNLETAVKRTVCLPSRVTISGTKGAMAFIVEGRSWGTDEDQARNFRGEVQAELRAGAELDQKL